MFNYSTLVLSSVALLVQFYANEYQREDQAATFKNLSPAPSIQSYDFIIVGGGTAGCVLANRLTQNGQYSVLLLEAGGNPPPQLQVPAFVPKFLPFPEIAFQYYSVPQIYSSRAYNNGSLPVRVGKVLGGTSSINGMFFNRGHPKDYDEWARATGDKSWRYENVLKYFKKLEKYEGEFSSNSAQHGHDGPVTVSTQKYAPGLNLWLEAGKELGYQNLDPNGPQHKSLGPIEYTRHHGRRVSSYDAYLKDIEGLRTNLKISRYSTVNEIIFDVDAKTAVGVSYTQHGIVHFTRAAKEIILSAGTFGSAQLLLKSGIGPKLELKNIPGIVPKIDLPVGRNLMDHPLVPLKILINDPAYAFDPVLNITEESIHLYHEKGEGPLSNDRSLTGQGFTVSSISIEEGQPDWPDIQFSLYSQDFSQLPIPVTAKSKSGIDDNMKEYAIHILPYLSRPRSVGSVKLNPTDLEKGPLIDFNFLSHPIDVKIYTEAINKSLEIFEKTSAYERIGARYHPEPLPECNSLEFRSDEYWSCYLSYMTFTGNHAVGTCRMGHANDPHAVVDSKLKLIGVHALRVIDASIMPTIVNSNTQAAVYMIAEKLADEILEEWAKKQCNR